MAAKRTPTTKDVALLQQLFKQGQLTLRPEFQRESVWPTAAKAYLIDTILHDRPIPLLFFQRTREPGTGRPAYEVVDGQQRLRAIFDFLDGRFRLSQTKGKDRRNRRFADLKDDDQDRIINYDLVIEEISGYTEADIRDVFVRLNKYLVKLSPQELRHAQETGAFKEFVEDLGTWDFWQAEKVFSKTQSRRMRPTEFAAEIVILLLEGPQDKKGAIDLYYKKYRDVFDEGDEIRARFQEYLRWIVVALPQLSKSRYRKAIDFYALIGALENASQSGERLLGLDPAACGAALRRFEDELERPADEQSRAAARYLVAASSQTDNLMPRRTRIGVLETVIAEV